jgi:hypothetical protein
MRLRRHSLLGVDHSSFHQPAGGYVDIELAGGAVDSDEALPFQMQNDFLGSFLG